jgi:hypothetical protein
MEFQLVQAGGIGEAKDLMIELFCATSQDVSPDCAGASPLTALVPTAISEGVTKVFCTAKHLQHKRSSIDSCY